jgi:hypothetical protein
MQRSGAEGVGNLAVDIEKAVRGSIRLLERMAEDPNAVLKALDPEEQDRVMTELRMLADWSTRVRNEADLRNLTDAVHCLIEETPALTAFLSSREGGVTAVQKRRTTRTITSGYTDSRPLGTSGGRTKSAYESWHVRAHADQIGNHVFNVRQKLEWALRERPQERWR